MRSARALLHLGAFCASLALRAPPQRAVAGLPLAHAGASAVVRHCASSTWDADALTAKTVADLKVLLRDRGLPVSGRKAELVSRLLASPGPNGGGPTLPNPGRKRSAAGVTPKAAAAADAKPKKKPRPVPSTRVAFERDATPRRTEAPT
mmetsp:Transcript_9665/g.28366  ORF Transcript_9665/g.28366 Transcript_9665/m.28366 type:complete len:149 (-) Transcript_9665:64-510(-)